MATEYISREAAIERITALINKSGKYTDYESGADDACFILEHEIPTADVVEVVRCRECINWNGNDCITMYGLCRPRPNDFCALGRKLEVLDDGKTT